MKKPSTMTRGRNGQLTIGLDVGDRSSFYCVLNEVGEVILEAKVATSPEAMKKVFGKMPQSRMALETGTHSPWISRVLSDLGHEVIVGLCNRRRTASAGAGDRPGQQPWCALPLFAPADRADRHAHGRPRR
jgi:hypothetical protein